MQYVEEGGKGVERRGGEIYRWGHIFLHRTLGHTYAHTYIGWFWSGGVQNRLSIFFFFSWHLRCPWRLYVRVRTVSSIKAGEVLVISVRSSATSVLPIMLTPKDPVIINP